MAAEGEEKKESFFSRLFKKTPAEKLHSGRSDLMPVPYLSKLEHGMIQPGQSIVIRGFCTLPTGFEIFLASGPNLDAADDSDKDDVAFHMRCDLEKKKYTINSLQNKEWGKEEKLKNPDFKHGEEFQIRIRVHDNKYEVFGNQKELALFDHRLPISSITHIFIQGDIELFCCSWEGKYYSVPYEAGIPGNFKEGSKLCLSGEPEKNAKNICINLHSGKDIALHLSVRYNEKDVVRNSQRDGNWEAEERKGDFLFHKRNMFDLVILCEKSQFKVTHDGDELCTFAHRMSPDNIDKLSVTGDIELQSVHFK